MTLGPLDELSQERLEFVWNAGAARYRSAATGQFVSRQYVQRALEARFAESAYRMRLYTDAMVLGDAPLDVWREAMAVEVRRAHLQATALGRGGWAQVTPSDWGSAGARIRSEYEYLRQFAQDIIDGKLSEAQIRSRMELYASSVNTSYWEGDRSAKTDAGFTEERRETTPAEHCLDCLELASRGWQPIGTLPPPGVDSRCQSNCKCIMAFRGPNDAE